jgi:hypothetical protein
MKYAKHVRIPDSSDSEVDEEISNETSQRSSTSTAPALGRAPPLRDFLQQLTAMRIQVENHPLNSNPGKYFIIIYIQ